MVCLFVCSVFIRTDENGEEGLWWSVGWLVIDLETVDRCYLYKCYNFLVFLLFCLRFI